MNLCPEDKINLPGKVGLALGSGSARGWAHMGVIKALTEADIRVDYVAGTSIGAVVGAVYASGKIGALEDVALQLDWRQIVSFLDVVFPKSGLIDGKKIADFVRTHVTPKNIEDLTLPFCAISTDLETGSEVVIRKGDVIEAVRASISIPGIFTPVRRNGMILVDGGLVDPVPVRVVREMGADFVIAVDLNHDIIVKKGAGKTPVSSLENISSDSGVDINPTSASLPSPRRPNTKPWRSSAHPARTCLPDRQAASRLPSIFTACARPSMKASSSTCSGTTRHTRHITG